MNLIRSTSRRSPTLALLAFAVATSTGLVSAAEEAPAAQKPLPVAIVDTLNQLSGGPHAGYRANHAKGVLVTGSFTPAPTAKSLSKALLLPAGIEPSTDPVLLARPGAYAVSYGQRAR